MSREIIRESYVLTTEEKDRRRNLPARIGAAFAFWEEVARARNLDYRTIMTDMESMGYVRFTGLPLGHGMHWCWPRPLKCRTDPSTVVV